VTHKDLKKLLQKAGLGGMFGRGIRLFDTEYAEVTFKDMENRVAIAKQELSLEGLVWEENLLDCDSFTIIYMAEVAKQWFLESKGKGLGTYPFGRAHMKGHDTNIGVADGNVYFWDYGELKYFDPKTIDEVELR